MKIRKALLLTSAFAFVLFMLIVIMGVIAKRHDQPFGTIMLVGLALVQLSITFYAVLRREPSPPMIFAESDYSTPDHPRKEINLKARQEYEKGLEARDEARLKAARRRFDRASSIQSDYWEALHERAHADRRLGNLDLAQETLEDIIERCPIKEEVRRSHNQLAMVYRDRKEFELSYRHFEIAYDACNEKNKNPVPLANLVVSSYRTGRIEQADRLRRILEKHPQFHRIRDSVIQDLESLGID